MQPDRIALIVLGICVVVMGGFLNWFYWRFKGLLKDSKKGDFLKSFKSILDTQTQNSKDLKDLQFNINNLRNSVSGHIQKVGLVKYNPYSETGGDHSFSLVLLDGKKNGIIITSLHSREATRVYIKDVKMGKSIIELSSEEKKALNQVFV